MKSGVYYLYEYINDQKSRNVGFLKLTQKSDGCSLQICARGLSVLQNEQTILSAIYFSENQFYTSDIKPVTCENHAITCRIELSEQDFSNRYAPDTLCGFLLTLSKHNCIAAVKDGILFSPSQKNAAEESVSPVPESAAKDSVSPTAEKAARDSAAPVSENTAGETASRMPNVRKIQRSELSILPRRHWHLANNNFLMHGYYNYNHLLLIEEDGHTLLGVPGIYDKREARAAQLFDFPVFSDSYVKSLNLSANEMHPYSRFGYWCRKLDTD